MFNTFQQMKWAVENKLAIEKVDGKFSTFKYHRNVHFEKLWNDRRNGVDLCEIRGHVYDNTNGQLVQAAPRKTFNYLENGTWKDVSLDTKVTAYKKYNGFMACASVHEGRLIISTTGTTTSDYAAIAKEEILKSEDAPYINLRYSNLYEIIVPQDPHIISEEKRGAIRLGSRSKETGVFFPEGSYIKVTLGDLLGELQNIRHEGFMVYDNLGRCCKLKSPYYLGKKFIMRSNAQLVEKMYNTSEGLAYTQKLDARWVPIVRKIVATIEKNGWLILSDQERRAIIENIETEYWI